MILSTLTPDYGSKSRRQHCEHRKLSSRPDDVQSGNRSVPKSSMTIMRNATWTDAHHQTKEWTQLPVPTVLGPIAPIFRSAVRGGVMTIRATGSDSTPPNERSPTQAVQNTARVERD